MKKHLCLLALLFYATIVFSQTQYGYVKTKGRMVNGEYVRGDGLPGATVFLKGNKSITVIDENGSFCFPVSAQTFMVENVRKNGYELIDVDVVKKPYSYSSNPIYLVMETPEQQRQDQLDFERKIRRTMEKKLRQREDELEELRTTHKITLEEYQKAMQKLYDDQNSSENLISEMAKQYAQMDYDQMDKKNQLISDAILNGRLTEADSLLRTKGDLRSRISEVEREEREEAQRELEIEQEKDNLAKAKVGTQKKRNDIVEDCKSLRSRFEMELRFDSAAYYVELLISLDTSNADWLRAGGSFYHNIGVFAKSEEYYLKALTIYQRSAEDNVFEICTTQNNLAVLYKENKLFSKSEALLKENLEIMNNLGGGRPLVSDNLHAYDESIVLMNLASLYIEMQEMKEDRYEICDSLIHRALEIMPDSPNYEYDEKQIMIANMLAFMSGMYYNLDIEESKRMIHKAIDVSRCLVEINPVYNDFYGSMLAFLGFLLKAQEHYEESECVYRKALDAISLCEDCVGIDRNTKEVTIASIWWSLAEIYQNNQRPRESEIMYEKALEVYRRYGQIYPRKYNSDLSQILLGLAKLYRNNTEHNAERESLLMESLEIERRLAQEHELKDPLNPQEHEQNIVFIQNEIGDLYLAKEEYEEALSCFIIGLEKLKSMAADDPRECNPLLVKTLYFIGLLYCYFEQFEKSEISYNEAIEICHRMSEEESPECDLFLACTQSALGDLYSYLDRIEESMIAYDEAVVVYEQLYQNKPELKEDYVGTLGKQSFLAIYLKEFAKAEQQAEIALNEDPSQQWIFSSLAASKLFQGKCDEAEEIYRNMILGLNDGMRNRFIEDLDDFEAAGVVPEGRKSDVERIRKILSE